MNCRLSEPGLGQVLSYAEDFASSPVHLPSLLFWQ